MAPPKNLLGERIQGSPLDAEWIDAQNYFKKALTDSKQQSGALFKKRRKDSNEKNHSFISLVIDGQRKTFMMANNYLSSGNVFEKNLGAGSIARNKLIQDYDGNVFALRIENVNFRNTKGLLIMRRLGRIHGKGQRDTSTPKTMEKYSIKQKFYNVIPYEEGKDLLNHIKNNTLDGKQKLIIGLKWCQALQEMHRKRILHSDIKMDNVMVYINPSNPYDIRVKIIDFDLSDILEKGKTSCQWKKTAIEAYGSEQTGMTTQTDISSLARSLSTPYWDHWTLGLSIPEIDKARNEGAYTKATLDTMISEIRQELGSFQNEPGMQDALKNIDATIAQQALFNQDITANTIHRDKIIKKDINYMNTAYKGGLTLLHWAVQNDDYRLIQSLLLNGADPNAYDEFGRNFIDIALEKYAGNDDKIAALINLIPSHILPNVVDQFGNSPLLQLLSQKEHYDKSINILIKNPATNLAYFNDQGKGALFLAIEFNHVTQVEQLIRHNKNLLSMLNFRGFPPLHEAILSGQFDVANKMLELGADITQPNSENKNILDMIIGVKDDSFILKLLKQIPQDTRNKLFSLKMQNNNSLLYELLQHNRPGYIEPYYPKTINYLINNHPNLDAMIKENNNILPSILKYNRFPYFGISILSKINDINIVGENQKSLLQLAIEQSNTDAIDYLIKRKDFNINAQDKLGCGFIHTALQTEQSIEKLYKYIFDKCLEENRMVNVNIQNNDGDTALHMAVRQRNMASFRFLMKNTMMNVNLQNNDGDTPLHIAVWEGNWRAVEFLIKKGADPTLKNNNQQSPLDMLENIIRNTNFNLDAQNMLSAMLDSNPDVFVKYNAGKRLLHLAVDSNKLDLLFDILKRITKNSLSVLTDKDSKGYTPLMKATRYSDWWYHAVREMLDIIIKNKIHIDQIEYDTVMRSSIATDTKNILEQYYKSQHTIPTPPSNSAVPIPTMRPEPIAPKSHTAKVYPISSETHQRTPMQIYAQYKGSDERISSIRADQLQFLNHFYTMAQASTADNNAEALIAAIEAIQQVVDRESHLLKPKSIFRTLNELKVQEFLKDIQISDMGRQKVLSQLEHINVSPQLKASVREILGSKQYHPKRN